MNYFIQEPSLEPAIIGDDYPQAYKFIKGYDPEAEKALFSTYKYRTSFPDFIPNLDGIRLSGSAKLTDFVSNGFRSNFFIISEKAKSVFEQHQLCMHQFYPLGLYKRNKKYDYFLLWFISDYSDFVDYKKTTFIKYNIFSEKRGDVISVISKEDLLEKRRIIKAEMDDMSQTIWGDRIVMSPSFDKELDFFEITLLDGGTYISERLKNNIEYKNLTGWDFIPANNLIIP